MSSAVTEVENSASNARSVRMKSTEVLRLFLYTFGFIEYMKERRAEVIKRNTH